MALTAPVAVFTMLLAGCAGHSNALVSDSVSASRPAGGVSSSPKPEGSSGVMFGGSKELLKQPSLGSKLAIVRTYHFPSPEDIQALKQGATLLTSFGHGDWARIASGTQDVAIKKYLAKVDQAAVDHHLSAIYVTFNHEADKVSGERPADFVKAWDHIHSLAAGMKVNWQQGGRIHWVLILTHGPYAQGTAQKYWPGKGNVDIVGVDGYNSAACSKHPLSATYLAAGQPEKPAKLFGPTVSFAAHHGNLPVFIAEWGSVPYRNPQSRADFIKAMTAFITAHPRIHAVSYWDSHGHKNACDYSIANDPAATKALAAMAANPHFVTKP
jgi:hypothetical protein